MGIFAGEIKTPLVRLGIQMLAATSLNLRTSIILMPHELLIASYHMFPLHCVVYTNMFLGTHSL